MEAIEGRLYAQIVDNKVHWIFTSDELPEWNNEMCPAVDITDLNPRPEIGWGYDGSVFTPSDVAAQSQTMIQLRIAEIKIELAELDQRRIRPLAEGDTDYLAILNAQALALRAELQTLLQG